MGTVKHLGLFLLWPLLVLNHHLIIRHFRRRRIPTTPSPLPDPHE